MGDLGAADPPVKGQKLLSGKVGEGNVVWRSSNR